MFVRHHVGAVPFVERLGSDVDQVQRRDWMSSFVTSVFEIWMSRCLALRGLESHFDGYGSNTMHLIMWLLRLRIFGDSLDQSSLTTEAQASIVVR